MWSLSEGSEELAEMVTDYLGQAYHGETARQNIEAGKVPLTEVWTGLSQELGLAGLTVPDDLGGAGGSLRDAAATLFAWGRGLAAVPLLSNLVASTAFHPLTSGSIRQELADDLLGGTVLAVSPQPLTGVSANPAADDRVALSGTAPAVLDAGIAERALLLVPGAGGSPAESIAVLVDLDQKGVTVSGGSAWCGVRAYGGLSLVNAEARVISQVDAAAEAQVLAVTRVLLAAERLGGSFTCLDMAVDYAKTREQFGHPIGSFQGVKHPLAELYVRIHLAQAQLKRALEEVDAGAPVAELFALLAAIHGERCFRQAADTNLDVHGGMGYTWEHDSHLYFRRSRWDSQLAGGQADDLLLLTPTLERAA